MAVLCLALGCSASDNAGKACRRVPLEWNGADGAHASCVFDRENIEFRCATSDRTGLKEAVTTRYASIDDFVHEGDLIGLIRAVQVIAQGTNNCEHPGTAPVWARPFACALPQEAEESLISYWGDGRPRRVLGRDVQAWDEEQRPTKIVAEPPCEAHSNFFSFDANENRIGGGEVIPRSNGAIPPEYPGADFFCTGVPITFSMTSENLLETNAQRTTLVCVD